MCNNFNYSYLFNGLFLEDRQHPRVIFIVILLSPETHNTTWGTTVFSCIIITINVCPTYCRNIYFIYFFYFRLLFMIIMFTLNGAGHDLTDVLAYENNEYIGLYYR